MTSPIPLRLRDSGPQWPYSLARLRQDEPQLSISASPHTGEIASWLSLTPPVVFIEPEATAPPEYDPATHRAVEVMPVEVDGTWRQAWALEELPPVPPEADWTEFASWLYDNGPIGEAMSAARLSTAPPGEPVTTALPMALLEARDGDLRVWAQAWGRFMLASGLQTEAAEPILAKALGCNLPADFIAATQDPTSFLAGLENGGGI